MGHSHDHTHTHTHIHDSNKSKKNILFALFLNFGFSVVELIGGLYTNSISILSDALHDFGDSIALVLAYKFEKYSIKKATPKYTYGYKRFVLLGAMINSSILFIGSVFVISEAVKRLSNPQEVKVEGMFFLAIAGIIVNGLAVLRTRNSRNLNERVVSLHMMEDLLGWIAVMIASIIMFFYDIPILDPILSICIACYILFNIYRNLQNMMRIILQGTPSNVNPEEIKKQIETFNGVASIHDVHIWTLDNQYNIMSMHVVVNNQTATISELEDLKMKIKSFLETMGIKHVTIEFENKNSECVKCDLK